MRIRTIKPEFFKDEDLAELAPATRLFFIGLWCCADRNGVIEHRPRMLKAEIAPWDDLDAEAEIEKLVGGRFLRRFEHDGRAYLWIRNWTKHQKIDKREQARFPDPGLLGLKKEAAAAEKESLKDDSPFERRLNADQTPTRRRVDVEGREGKGREGKGREGRNHDQTPTENSPPGLPFYFEELRKSGARFIQQDRDDWKLVCELFEIDEIKTAIAAVRADDQIPRVRTVGAWLKSHFQTGPEKREAEKRKRATEALRKQIGEIAAVADRLDLKNAEPATKIAIARIVEADQTGHLTDGIGLDLWTAQRFVSAVEADPV